MIHFQKHTLSNGLRVLAHEDPTTPIAVVNVMYDVGARDEHPEKTGFAHLFEHLMFGGSINVPDYDEPLQVAGGENNAYTTSDITNYYCSLPAQNLETALWLESDRMLSLAFGEKSLEVQRKVVCEEFKEHYINKPYGDVWHKLRAMAYQVHPYQWMTIGKELSHVENARLQDVKDFFFKHYRPVNAVLVVAGNIKPDEVFRLAEKWFGSIPSGEKYNRNLPAEPEQQEARRQTVYADVPANAFYKCWHMGSRLSNRYYVADLITEILNGGQSSRLNQALVKEKKLFSKLDCHQSGSVEPGLFTIEGKLAPGVAPETAEAAIEEELEKLKQEKVPEAELQKVKNKTESLIAFEDISLTNRASSLAFYEVLGDATLMNSEPGKYEAVTVEQVLEESRRLFTPANSSTLYYLSKTSAGN
ncbi:MAG: insulinase family protein [Dinghuibacter sp.]|nr:insulinase family protein [Dinghuibacter sp.]